MSFCLSRFLSGSVQLPLTDPQNQREGWGWRVHRERGGERCRFLILEEFFLPLSLSQFLSRVSSSSLSLWCNSMCFSGPSWVGALQWKTSEFLDVFSGDAGARIVSCVVKSSLSSAGHAMTLEPGCLFLSDSLFGSDVDFDAVLTNLLSHWLSVEQLQDLTSHTDAWLRSVLFYLEGK